MVKTALKPSNYFLLYFAFASLVALFSSWWIWVLLLGFGIMVVFSLNHWKIKFLPLLFASLIIGSFAIHLLLNHLLVVPTEFNENKFVVRAIRTAYLLVERKGVKYYLPLLGLEPKKVYLYQTLSLSGCARPLSLTTNYFEFDFQRFLHQKNVFQELVVQQIRALKTGWLFKLNKFYQSFLNNEFGQVFILSNHDQNLLLINGTSKVGVTYLLNFGGLPLFLVSFSIANLLKRSQVSKKMIIYCALVLDVVLLCFCFTLNFPFVLTRTTLMFLVRNGLKLKHLKPSFASLWIIVYSCLICLDNSLIQSEIFLYYLVVLLFFKFDSTKSFFNQLWWNFLFSNLTFGIVNMLVDYRFYYFNELFDLFLAPSLGLTNLFTWFTFWIPGIETVYDFLNNLLVKVLLFFGNFNYYYACGKIPLYFYLLYFGFLKLIFYTSTFSTYWWCLIFINLICLTLFFVYKMVWFPIGIEILNVGNGQSVVLRQKGKVLLFDAGAGPGHSKTILKNYCQYWGIRKVESLFLSHYHDDHYNQIDALLADKIQVKQVIKREIALPFYQIGQAKIHLFNLSQQNKNENNNSLVYLINFHHQNWVIMSDLEMDGETRLLLDENFLYQTSNQVIDYLILGHHGSKTSTSPQLLMYLKPKLVFISAEKRGLRQFPNQETLDTLNWFKIPYKITNNQKNFFIK